jgi:hypothetical protein
MSNFFKNLIYREVKDESQKDSVKHTTSTIPGNNEIPASSYYGAPNQVALSSTMVDDFVNRLQNLIEQNNQPGFDFLEFLESLFESNPTPGPAEYNMVFRIAKKMNPSLSTSMLLDSARTYKNLVESAASLTIAEGEKKKQTLQQELENKRQTLDSDIKSIALQMEALQKQIDALRQDSITKSNQLSAIDIEYRPKFVEIDSKVVAMNTAKEKVISSIFDVEAGIQANIK